LSGALWGAFTGSLSPPFRTASSVLRYSPAFNFLAFLASAEWHLRHCSVRTGRIFCSKNSTARGSSVLSDGGGSAALAGRTVRAVKTMPTRTKVGAEWDGMDDLGISLHPPPPGTASTNLSPGLHVRLPSY